MMEIAALANKKKKKKGNVPRHDLIQRVRTTPAKRRGTGETYVIFLNNTASIIICYLHQGVSTETLGAAPQSRFMERGWGASGLEQDDV